MVRPRKGPALVAISSLWIVKLPTPPLACTQNPWNGAMSPLLRSPDDPLYVFHELVASSQTDTTDDRLVFETSSQSMVLIYGFPAR